MNLLVKKTHKKQYCMEKQMHNKRSEHKKKLKEVRISNLEKQLKSNILKRKKASKKQNG